MSQYRVHGEFHFKDEATAKSAMIQFQSAFSGMPGFQLVEVSLVRGEGRDPVVAVEGGIDDVNIRSSVLTALTVPKRSWGSAWIIVKRPVFSGPRDTEKFELYL